MQLTNKRLTTIDIQMAKDQTPLVCLTCYTAPVAKLLDMQTDILLVGDSLGMILYGMETTLPVTVEMMIAHGRAVVKSSKKALVVVDMPFSSYQTSKEQAFENAASILAQTGCSAVKLEGGEEMAETVEFLVKRGIPVMGHIGVMPQHVHARGGYRFAGKEQEEANRMIEDAFALQEAGAFSLVMECVEQGVAKDITAKLSIPTIGIGSSRECDGQVLVTEDMLGLAPNEHKPRFIKQYADVATIIENAAKQYADEVKSRRFPEEIHSFKRSGKVST